MDRATFQKGDIIFRQGDLTHCMYDIVRGRVGIYDRYGTPEGRLLATLGAGSCFGEMGLVEASLRSADAVALEDGTEVTVVTPETFSVYFRDCPEKVYGIMSQMSGRIRSMTKEYLTVCRTAAGMLEAQETGNRESGGLKRDIKRVCEVYAEAVRNGWRSFRDLHGGAWR